MTDCKYHAGTEATHELDRGERGDPEPLCDFCVDELRAFDSEAVDELVSTL